MNKRIIISVTTDLSIDQRVQKLALSMQNIGFDVLLLGRKTKRSRSFNASFPFKRMRLFFETGFLFYAEYNIRLLLFLLSHKTDILFSCDTDTLAANYIASKLTNRKLVFDAHEIFPEVPELVEKPFVKKCWETIENIILPRVSYSMTVCESIANYYNEKYAINMQVVRNIAYLNNENIKPLILSEKKVILYQGTLNDGRGLEWVIDSMPLLDNCELIIIGSGLTRKALKRRVSKLEVKDKVQFIGKVLPEELTLYTKAADIGLCLLENKGLSYYYSLPNRVFDYIQAGIPILASDYPEIRNIVVKHNTGVVINKYDPQYIADTIKKMLSTGKESYQENLKTLSKELCWEKEQEKLFNLLSKVVNDMSRKKRK